MRTGPNDGSVREAQLEDTRGVLQYSIPEPVPVRFGNSLGFWRPRTSSCSDPLAGMVGKPRGSEDSGRNRTLRLFHVRAWWCGRAGTQREKNLC